VASAVPDLHAQSEHASGTGGTSEFRDYPQISLR
jgi:hypothetical protein